VVLNRAKARLHLALIKGWYLQTAQDTSDVEIFSGDRWAVRSFHESLWNRFDALSRSASSGLRNRTAVWSNSGMFEIRDLTDELLEMLDDKDVHHGAAARVA
jgi:hypothetical protein